MGDNKRIKAKEIKLITVFVQKTRYIVTFTKLRSLFKKRVAVPNNSYKIIPVNNS